MKFSTGHDLDNDGVNDVYVHHDTDKISVPSGFGTTCVIALFLALATAAPIVLVVGVVICIYIAAIAFPIYCFFGVVNKYKQIRQAAKIRREEERVARLNLAVAKWEESKQRQTKRNSP